MYDIIGDVHGHADELIALLRQMDYEQRNGVWSHADRLAVFVGDLIDRGPKNREAVRLVRAMVEAGAAKCVMGNHEFNALAFHTPHPDRPDEFLRPHSEKNLRQHAATLAQIPESELADHLEWFRELPCWLDLGSLRVVHACWSRQEMEVIAQARSQSGIDRQFLHQAVTEGTELFHAIEIVLKGPECRLPDGITCVDKEGHRRTRVRRRWYQKPTNGMWDEVTFGEVPELSGRLAPAELIADCEGYPAEAPPVFFGHYWLRADQPRLLAANAACLDYSIARGGKLVAYRFDGAPLSDSNFIWVATAG